MSVSEEKLMAYVDGELDAAGRAEVEAAIASDANLARRVENQAALRRKLRATYDKVLDEPVPDRLVQAARTAPATSIAGIEAARAAKAARAGADRRWSGPVWLAMAASLVAGLFLALALLRSPLGSPFQVDGGQLVARGNVAEALTNQLAASQPANTPVHVGISFRDRRGDLCRTFVLREHSPVAGIACRRDDTWAVQALARYAADEPNGGYRPAAGELPPAVLSVVEGSIVGEPLDAQGEETARRSGWSNKK